MQSRRMNPGWLYTAGRLLPVLLVLVGVHLQGQQAASAQTLDYSGGFVNDGNIQINGTGALIGSMARLTSGGVDEAGSFFSTGVYDIRNFVVTFDFRMIPVIGIADGITFTIQNVGPSALGGGGGDIGYGGIGSSIGVKFDTFNNIEPSSSTVGYYTGGASPFGGLDTTPVDLGSGDDFRAVLQYVQATGTLGLVLTDLTTSAVYSTLFTSVDIPTAVGGDTAYIGITGSTGALTSTQDVLNFRYDSITASAVPEGNSFLMMGMGLLSVGALFLRRRRQA